MDFRRYTIGEAPLCWTAFRDPVTGNNVSPDSLTVRIKPPGEEASDFAYPEGDITRSDASAVLPPSVISQYGLSDDDKVFHVNVSVTKAGEWHLHWQGAGTWAGAADDAFKGVPARALA